MLWRKAKMNVADVLDEASDPEQTNYKSVYNIVCAVFYTKLLEGEMMSSQQMNLSQNGNSSSLNTKMK
jgi:hypothetical protein